MSNEALTLYRMANPNAEYNDWDKSNEPLEQFEDFEAAISSSWDEGNLAPGKYAFINDKTRQIIMGFTVERSRANAS